MKRPVKAAFSARGSKCPICKQPFRRSEDCPHSIGQAMERIEQDYIHAVVRYEVAQQKATEEISEIS